MSLFLNGVETNTVMWNGVETTGVWNGEVIWGNSVPSFKTLTLYHSEGGTLTANELTGYPGDTINLSTAYNTYWRFSGYQITGDGSLVGNTYTFGGEDASICACYKVNAFTASGGWEKGSDVSKGINGKTTWDYDLRKYATRNASTGDIPASWYSTSSRWNPSNASAYKITLNPEMGFTASYDWVRGYNNSQTTTVKCCTYTDSTITNSQTFTGGNKAEAYATTTSSFNYSKSFTSTTQGTCSISAHLNITTTLGYSNKYGRLGYIANRTSGTWVATGIAP